MGRVDPRCIDYLNVVGPAQIQPDLIQARASANQKEVSKRVGYAPLVNHLCIDDLVCNNQR